ncbi:hypothetical protein CCACVL1_09381 [Corchorus capsularis]|uniref:Uncharacterized protein n=1 Tax=Corchorus capsularis TaxID=210143 RepID=A0A1R3IWI0_COCAP|nr:hypothetical protein CCACVL1_09381 [Corchorus capsularis]
MGSENNTAIAEDQKPRSVFQGDGSFLKKILARKSFRGNSIRLFYTENPAAVPFDWETQPGTPKHPQSETIPRIKPPPAMHSRALDKPKFASSPHHHTRVAMSCFTFPRRRSCRKTHMGKKAHDAKADKGVKTPQSDVVSSVVNHEDSKPSSDHSRTSSSTSSFSTSSSSSSSSLRGLAKELFVKLSF